MNKILVTYATNAGSTAKVAQAVADELAQTADVDVLPLKKVTSTMAIPPSCWARR